MLFETAKVVGDVKNVFGSPQNILLGGAIGAGASKLFGGDIKKGFESGVGGAWMLPFLNPVEDKILKGIGLSKFTSSNISRFERQGLNQLKNVLNLGLKSSAKEAVKKIIGRSLGRAILETPLEGLAFGTEDWAENDRESWIKSVVNNAIAGLPSNIFFNVTPSVARIAGIELSNKKLNYVISKHLRELVKSKKFLRKLKEQQGFADFSATVGKTASEIEIAEGWRPGEKAKFDEAMLTKDAKKIEEILPRVPDSYKAKFKTKIEDILGKKISKQVKGKAKPQEELEPLKYKSIEEPEEVKIAGKDFLGTPPRPTKKDTQEYLRAWRKGTLTPKQYAKKLKKARKEVERLAKQEFNDWLKTWRGETYTQKQLRSPEIKIPQQVQNVINKHFKELKDVGVYEAGMKDPKRIFRKVFGKYYKVFDKHFLKRFDSARGEQARYETDLKRKLYKDVIKKLGIKKGSKESAAVQLFGEGKITLKELKKQFPKKWNDIVEAGKWFRENFDRIWLDTNAARRKNGLGEIPYLKNYFRHFRKHEGLHGLKNIITSRQEVDPALSGISYLTKPYGKWSSIFQKRTGNKTVYDAVGGLLNYIPQISHAKYIDPFVAEFRGLERLLTKAQVEAGAPEKLGNFKRYLNREADSLAGKTPQIARVVQERILGRRLVNVLRWINNRVKADVVVGNLRSALNQIANIPQGIASAKQHSVKGAWDLLMGNNVELMKKSDFLADRYKHKEDLKFYEKLFEQPLKAAVWVLNLGDEAGTKFIWLSHLNKAIKEGIDDPVRYADLKTGDLVGRRGIGEMPLNQRDPIVQLVLPFTLEVGNAMHVLKDFIDAKDFAGIVLLFLANNIFNSVTEKVTGSRILFDPIDAFSDAVTDDETTAVEKVGRLFGEYLSNTPEGQLIASLYPEYGMLGLPGRAKLFGDYDPTRYGGGLLFMEGVKDPLFKLLPPFGGEQIKRTLEGVKSWSQGYITNRKGNIRFLVEQSPERLVQMALFGKYSIPEAREYFEKGRKPLSERQTFLYKQIQDPQYYERLMSSREIKSIEKKIKDIQQQVVYGKLSEEEGAKRIGRLMEEIRSLVKTAEVAPKTTQLRETEITDIEVKQPTLVGRTRKGKKVKIKKGIIKPLKVEGMRVKGYRKKKATRKLHKYLKIKPLTKEDLLR